MASAFLQDEGGLGASVIHVSPSSASIVVPDAHLLFSAHFSRSGPDLVLTGADGRHYIIPGYFSSEHPPALAAPNGATLSADVIGLMAGSPTPGEYAQTQPTPPPDLIGKVEKLLGNATVIRNGVSVTLNMGDAVYQSDVIQTGPDSKVGIGFPDGTALELLANTRMALSEYSYDPNGHANSALFSYVEGTFGFFAGKVAHTGDMKIATPVATMGIRGTTGVMGQGTDANGHDFYWQSIYDDPHTNISGSWDDFGQNPDGTTFVEVTVSQPGEMTVFTLQGPGLPPLITTIPIPQSYNLIGLQIIEDLGDIIQLLNVAPHSLGTPGSPENPQEILPPENLPGLGNGPQLIFYVPIEPPGGPPVIVPIVLPPPSPSGPQTGFIWPSGTGTWDTAFGWIGDAVPISAPDTVTIKSGLVQYGNNGADNYTIAALLVDQPAELDIVSATLNVQNGLDDAGKIVVGGGDPPSLTVSGPVTIESGGKLLARGSGAVVDLTVATVDNSGTIAARHGGDVEFIGDTVTNSAAGADSAPGKIKSVGFGSVVDFSFVDFDNGGVVLANDCGGIFFVDAAVTNDAGGKFTAKDFGSITFATTPVDNSGVMRAIFGGFIKFEDLVTNETGGDIRSAGCDSCVIFTGNELDNFGTVAAAWGGDIKFFDATINNEAAATGGTIEAKDWATVKVYGGTLTNDLGALVEADRHGAIEIKDAFVLNSGKFKATDCGLICIQGCDGSVTNNGEFVARDFGTIVFAALSGVTNDDGGRIEARDHGRVVFADMSVTNYDQEDGFGPFHHTGFGVIAAIGCGSQVDLADATIAGGRIESRDGGVIETVYGCNTFLNVTLDGAVVKVDCGTSLALDGGVSGIAALIDGCVTLEGGGVVTMAYGSYQILAGHHGGAFINDTTISGLGQIGQGDGALLFINEGVLKAHLIGPDHGNEFIIDTGIGECGAPTTINAGLLEACGPCVTLLIENTTLDNSCGTIAAYGPGAAIDLVNSTIFGGTLATGDLCDPCFGIIEILSPSCDGTNTVVFDGTAEKVTVDGFVQVQEGATLELVGTIDNKGTIDVDDAWSGADLAIRGTVELRGGGTAILEGPDDQITGIPCTDAVLKNFSTIRGDGRIGAGDGSLKLINEAKGTIEAIGGICDPLTIDTGDRTVVNDGLMDAAWFGVLDIESKLDNSGDVVAEHHGQVAFDANVHNEDGGEIEAQHGGLVTFDGVKVTNDGGAVVEARGACSVVNIDCSTVNNAGTIEAKHGGSIVIVYSTVHNAGGSIEADGCGSTVDLIDATIRYGMLETSEGGLIQTVCGDNTFDSVTIADRSYVLVNDGTSLTLEGTIHNHGTIDVDGDTGARLIIDGTVTLDGHGAVMLDGCGDAIVGGTCDATLDNVNNTISGFGQIGGCDGSLELINEVKGTIDANDPSGILILDPTETTNTGTLKASDGGTLEIESNVDNTSGMIATAGSHSSVELVDVTVTGGQLRTGSLTDSSGGVIEIVATDGGASLFDGTDQEVTVNGYVNVDPGAALALAGTINVLGTINVDGVAGADLTIDNAVTLDGSGGFIVLDDHGDAIVSGSDAATLDNFSNISGQGRIGDASLSFINDVTGVIDADIDGKTLIVNTASSLTNEGTLEASNGGRLLIKDAVNPVDAAGYARIEGGTLEFDAAAHLNQVTFDNDSGYGELVIGDPKHFSGTISGFAGTESATPSLANSDEIDLVGVDYTSEEFSEHYKSSTGVLTVSDGTHTAKLTFVGFTGTFQFESDGSGGTLIFDPPAADKSSALATVDGSLSFADNDAGSALSASVAPEGSNYLGHFGLSAISQGSGNASVEFDFSLDNDQNNVGAGQTVTQSYHVTLTDAQDPAANATQTVSVSLGGPSNDNFVFAPGIGAETIVNFNPQHDTIELDHFANAQSMLELGALITNDVHGNAVIDLGNHDSITLPGMTAARSTRGPADRRSPPLDGGQGIVFRLPAGRLILGLRISHALPFLVCPTVRLRRANRLFVGRFQSRGRIHPLFTLFLRWRAKCRILPPFAAAGDGDEGCCELLA